METRLGNLDPTRNAVWRKNIEREVWPLLELLVSMEGWRMSLADANHCLRIARRVEEVYEHLKQLDSMVFPTEFDIRNCREGAQRDLRYLDVRMQMYEVKEVFDSNVALNRKEE